MVRLNRGAAETSTVKGSKLKTRQDEARYLYVMIDGNNQKYQYIIR